MGALQYCTLTCSDINYVVNQLCQFINSPSIEIEYHSIALATTKLHWIQMLFWDLGISIPCPPTLWCGNVCDNALASNIIFYSGTKHVEVNYYLTLFYTTVKFMLAKPVLYPVFRKQELLLLSS